MSNIELTIFGEKYKVTFSKSEFIEKCNEYDFYPESTRGICVNNERTIYINSEQDFRSMLHTIIHECLHAMGNVTGHRELAESTIKNEMFVDMIASGIIQLLEQDNFVDLLKTFLGRDKICQPINEQKRYSTERNE